MTDYKGSLIDKTVKAMQLVAIAKSFSSIRGGERILPCDRKKNGDGFECRYFYSVDDLAEAAIAIVRDHSGEPNKMVKPLSDEDKRDWSHVLQQLEALNPEIYWGLDPVKSVRDMRNRCIAIVKEFMAIPPLGSPDGKSTAAVGVAATMGGAVPPEAGTSAPSANSSKVTPNCNISVNHSKLFRNALYPEEPYEHEEPSDASDTDIQDRRIPGSGLGLKDVSIKQQATSNAPLTTGTTGRVKCGYCGAKEGQPHKPMCLPAPKQQTGDDSAPLSGATELCPLCNEGGFYTCDCQVKRREMPVTTKQLAVWYFNINAVDVTPEMEHAFENVLVHLKPYLRTSEPVIEPAAILNSLGDLKEPWDRLRPYVNDTPELISLLYDLDLMPEQVHVRRNFVRMMQLAEWHKHHATVPVIVAQSDDEIVKTLLERAAFAKEEADKHDDEFNYGLHYGFKEAVAAIKAMREKS